LVAAVVETGAAAVETGCGGGGGGDGGGGGGDGVRRRRWVREAWAAAGVNGGRTSGSRAAAVEKGARANDDDARQTNCHETVPAMPPRVDGYRAAADKKKEKKSNVACVRLGYFVAFCARSMYPPEQRTAATMHATTVSSDETLCIHPLLSSFPRAGIEGKKTRGRSP